MLYWGRGEESAAHNSNQPAVATHMQALCNSKILYSGNKLTHSAENLLLVHQGKHSWSSLTDGTAQHHGEDHT